MTLPIRMWFPFGRLTRLRSLSLFVDPCGEVDSLESKFTVRQAGEGREETLTAPAVKRAACDLQLGEHLLECHVRTACGEFAVSCIHCLANSGSRGIGGGPATLLHCDFRCRQHIRQTPVSIGFQKFSVSGFGNSRNPYPGRRTVGKRREQWLIEFHVEFLGALCNLGFQPTHNVPQTMELEGYHFT